MSRSPLAPPVDVLYIAGSGRCGSTMLSRLLGEVDGFVNVGEAALHFLMKCPPIPCGCGASVQECSFWKDTRPQPELRERGHHLFRLRHAAQLALQGLRPSAEVRSLLASMRDVYRSILDRTGARVIVDSSKNPAMAYLLGRTPGIRLSVVHLIRAPHGVASSWRHAKGYLPPAPAGRVALHWSLLNGFSEFVSKANRTAHHWTLRYENLVEQPEGFVAAIAGELLGRQVDCPFLQGNRATVRVQHILAGNPDKLERLSFVVEKREPRLPFAVHLLISMLTFPLMLRYGYVLAHTALLAPFRLRFEYDFMERRRLALAPDRDVMSLPGDRQPCVGSSNTQPERQSLT